MKVIRATNVNDALISGIELLKKHGDPIVVRGMKTLECDEPVTTVYEYPWQRVLFDERRDANPFFHFMESMWMLGGRNDVAFLSQFNSTIHQFSDDGETFYGAYGYRLRKLFGIDQFAEAIKKLQKDRTSRQCVLAMWNPNSDLIAESRDIPCNDLIMLKVRNGALNMTVCCRSNDIIWGCYGANAVHFSYIHEYLASMIGVSVGTYRQISDSFHGYIDRKDWEKLQNLPEPTTYHYPYYRMITYIPTFDQELEHFLNGTKPAGGWENKFFTDVAIPMKSAWFEHKETKGGWYYADMIRDLAWRKACMDWLLRRGDGRYLDESP